MIVPVPLTIRSNPGITIPFKISGAQSIFERKDPHQGPVIKSIEPNSITLPS
jgi:hypothetical protein